MVTSSESTVKISKWLLDEVERYVKSTKRTKTDFVSKKHFVDRAVISFLESKGVRLAA